MLGRGKQGASSDWGKEGKKEKGVILPYRRLGADISFPNLVEGTCREASRTYHGKPCGRYQRKGGRGRRGNGCYIITENGKIQKREWGGGS